MSHRGQSFPTLDKPLPQELRPDFDAWWLDQEAWPPHRLKTPSGEAVFWGHALTRIGLAVFGEEWVGPEFSVRAPPTFPPWPAPYPAGRGHPGEEICRRAKDFVETHDPEFYREAAAALTEWGVNVAKRITTAPAPIPTVTDVASGRWTPPPRSINSADTRSPPPNAPAKNLAEYLHGKPPPDLFYARARQLAPLVGAEGAKWELRARQLEARVADACVMGELRTIWLNAERQPRWFGDSWWNVEPGPARRERFALCRIAPNAPFARPSTQVGTSWIYVLKADLDGFLVTVAAPADEGAPTGEVAARRELLALCKAHYEDGVGPVPIGRVWRQEAQERFGIGTRAAARAWGRAAERYPALSERAGKPKTPRGG